MANDFLDPYLATLPLETARTLSGLFGGTALAPIPSSADSDWAGSIAETMGARLKSGVAALQAAAKADPSGGRLDVGELQRSVDQLQSTLALVLSETDAAKKARAATPASMTDLVHAVSNQVQAMVRTLDTAVAKQAAGVKAQAEPFRALMLTTALAGTAGAQADYLKRAGGTPVLEEVYAEVCLRHTAARCVELIGRVPAEIAYPTSNDKRTDSQALRPYVFNRGARMLSAGSQAMPLVGQALDAAEGVAQAQEQGQPAARAGALRTLCALLEDNRQAIANADPTVRETDVKTRAQVLGTAVELVRGAVPGVNRIGSSLETIRPDASSQGWSSFADAVVTKRKEDEAERKRTEAARPTSSSSSGLSSAPRR